MTDHAPRDVILLSTADWDWPYWTNKQHIAVGLAARAYRVLYVETVGIRQPRLRTVDLRRMSRRVVRGLSPPRNVRPNLWVMSPLTIPAAQRFRAVAEFNDRQLVPPIRSWIGGDGRQPIIWTYHPYMLDVANALPGATIVYHCVDDVAAIPGVDRTAYEAAERTLIGRAHTVFVTSQELADRCAALAPGRVHFVGNPVDIEHFASARSEKAIPDDLAAIAHPRLGYVGALSDYKVDFELIEFIATARPDWNLVFIGDGGQHDAVLNRLRSRPNVHLLGWRPYTRLPDYLRGIDVALLPQRINRYTRAMFPMKFFEYLAAGRPVVATPLPALHEYHAICRIASTAEEMIRETALVLGRPAQFALPLDHAVLQANSRGRRLDTMLGIIGPQPSV